MSIACGPLGASSEQPHNSIETVASAALVIRGIFAPITAQLGTARVVFVTPITSEKHPPSAGGALTGDVRVIRGATLSKQPDAAGLYLTKRIDCTTPSAILMITGNLIEPRVRGCQSVAHRPEMSLASSGIISGERTRTDEKTCVRARAAGLT